MKITWLQNFSNLRKDSVWYGGDIVKIEFDKYICTIEAVGDIGIILNGEYYKDHNNSGCIAEFLFENNIRTDNQLKKSNIEWLNNNWYELRVWDNELEDWIDNGIDNIIDDLDKNDNFKWLIKEVETMKEGL